MTGLAAGFGGYRRVLLPNVYQVANFPLVQAAVQGSGPPADPLARLQVLDQDIPVELSTIFLAAGVHFTSFKQINSFALLVTFLQPRLRTGCAGSLHRARALARRR